MGKKPKWEFGIYPRVNWLRNRITTQSKSYLLIRASARTAEHNTDCALETMLHHRKLGLAIAERSLAAAAAEATAVAAVAVTLPSFTVTISLNYNLI